MRVEQHYATQTAGLDLTFDISSALFFATHKFEWDARGLDYYLEIPRGEHQGIIYLFRFGSPSVKKTEFLIRDFDFFRTHRPQRILRQSCGLPLFGPHERNIAVTDVDCVIELDPDFDAGTRLTSEYMFPNEAEDDFYRKLLELKDRNPKLLSDVVEYRWARYAEALLHPEACLERALFYRIRKTGHAICSTGYQVDGGSTNFRPDPNPVLATRALHN